MQHTPVDRAELISVCQERADNKAIENIITTSLKYARSDSLWCLLSSKQLVNGLLNSVKFKANVRTYWCLHTYMEITTCIAGYRLKAFAENAKGLKHRCQVKNCQNTTAAFGLFQPKKMTVDEILHFVHRDKKISNYKILCSLHEARIELFNWLENVYIADILPSNAYRMWRSECRSQVSAIANGHCIDFHESKKSISIGTCSDASEKSVTISTLADLKSNMSTPSTSVSCLSTNTSSSARFHSRNIYNKHSAAEVVDKPNELVGQLSKSMQRSEYSKLLDLHCTWLVSLLAAMELSPVSFSLHSANATAVPINNVYSSNSTSSGVQQQRQKSYLFGSNSAASASSVEGALPYVYANPAHSELIGYEREYLMGKSFQIAFPDMYTLSVGATSDDTLPDEGSDIILPKITYKLPLMVNYNETLAHSTPSGSPMQVRDFHTPSNNSNNHSNNQSLHELLFAPSPLTPPTVFSEPQEHVMKITEMILHWTPSAFNQSGNTCTELLSDSSPGLEGHDGPGHVVRHLSNDNDEAPVGGGMTPRGGSSSSCDSGSSTPRGNIGSAKCAQGLGDCVKPTLVPTEGCVSFAQYMEKLNLNARNYIARVKFGAIDGQDCTVIVGTQPILAADWKTVLYYAQFHIVLPKHASLSTVVYVSNMVETLMDKIPMSVAPVPPVMASFSQCGCIPYPTLPLPVRYLMNRCKNYLRMVFVVNIVRRRLKHQQRSSAVVVPTDR